MPRGESTAKPQTRKATAAKMNRDGLRSRTEDRKAVTNVPKFVSPASQRPEVPRKKDLVVIGTKEKDSSLTYGRLIVEALRAARGKSMATRAIYQYIATNYAVPDTFKSYVRSAMKKGLATGWLETVPPTKTFRLANPREPTATTTNFKKELPEKRKPGPKKKRNTASRNRENPYDYDHYVMRKSRATAFDFIEQDRALAEAELVAKKAVKLPSLRRSDVDTSKRALNPDGTVPRGRPMKTDSLQAVAAASLALIADAALFDLENGMKSEPVSSAESTAAPASAFAPVEPESESSNPHIASNVQASPVRRVHREYASHELETEDEEDDDEREPRQNPVNYDSDDDLSILPIAKPASISSPSKSNKKAAEPAEDRPPRRASAKKAALQKADAKKAAPKKAAAAKKVSAPKKTAPSSAATKKRARAEEAPVEAPPVKRQKTTPAPKSPKVPAPKAPKAPAAKKAAPKTPAPKAAAAAKKAAPKKTAAKKTAAKKTAAKKTGRK